jgi:serine/threonine-protein kinase
MRESKPPAAIGPYQVRRELGRGAFGVVYQGYDTALDREVAIKVLNQSALDSKNAVERFLREARVVAKMHHNHIVPVFQLGEYEGRYYIASKFIPGQTLSDAIPDNGMQPEKAVELVLQLLDALAYAHDQNVMHRDVKPANALLDQTGQLYLTDFGLAGWVGQAKMTRAGTKLGTPSYMAPEQAEGKTEETGSASDQYSAGVVLYELLTNHLPFEGGPLAALLYNVAHTPPPPPSEWRRDLDPRLEAICLKALAKKPSDRYPSCRDFAAALRRWQAGPRTPARRATPPVPVAAPRPAPVRRPVSEIVSAELDEPELSMAELDEPDEPVMTTEPAPSRRAWLYVVLGGVAAAILAGGAGIVYLVATGSDDARQGPGLREQQSKGKK